MDTAQYEKAMAKVDEMSRAYDTDPGHTRHVTELALALYDGLEGLHNFNKQERRLLEISSRLHDVGWAKPGDEDHNKASRDIILKEDIPGLSENEKAVCAMVARYHTKALPDPAKHRPFAALSTKDRNVVEWLAALLRVADALDSGHEGAVKKLKARVEDKAVVVRMQAAEDCAVEIRRARDKEDLLIKKSGREVVYQC